MRPREAAHLGPSKKKRNLLLTDTFVALSKNVTRWLDRHSHVMLLLISGVLLVFLAVGVEISLRALGYSYIKKPDPLVLADTFHANEHGLFVANPASATFKGSGIEINSDGFRSPEFDAAQPGGRQGTSVAILGDSFTWGATANPISRSFPDILRTNGYTVHNFGIPATGPLHYRKVAEVYLPRLKPNVVVVALYLGNDILATEWEPPPGQPIYYVLENGQWITPFDENGNYTEDIEAAYERYFNQFGKVRRFLRETATGTLVLKMARIVMARIYTRQAASDPTMSQGFKSADGGPLVRYAHTYTELGKIRRLAEKLGAQYYTVVIPALGQGCLNSKDFSLEAQRDALKEFQPVYVELSDHYYYGVPDCHLNNEGHAAVAQAMMKLLDHGL